MFLFRSFQKLGISVAQLNQSLQSDLKTAFSTSLQIPKDNAFINKVQVSAEGYSGNNIFSNNPSYI